MSTFPWQLPDMLWKLLIIGAILGMAAYLGTGALVYFWQDGMVFVPTKASFADMEVKARAMGFKPWTNQQNEYLGWESVDGNSENVLLVLHGNGGNSSFYAMLRQYCAREAGNWKTYLLEYPGYGCRGGVPSEKSLTDAAVQAVDVLGEVSGRKIWVLGQSLGSGVACAAAGARPTAVSGLILLTPFNSLVATAAFHYPWFPIAPFMKTRFDSEKNLSGYNGPVAILVSGKDSTTPPALGQKLFDGYHGRKRLWLDPESDHDVTAVLASDWPQIVGWLQDKTPSLP